MVPLLVLTTPVRVILNSMVSRRACVGLVGVLTVTLC